MNSPYIVPALVRGSALRNYLLKHVTKEKTSGMYLVHTPLRVFKKALANRPRCFEFVLVNLTIPKGARIYVPGLTFASGDSPAHRKMRASSAVVHSVFGIDLKPVESAKSDYDLCFKYVPGQTVTPRYPFTTTPVTCASGIHFFLNVGDALAYSL